MNDPLPDPVLRDVIEMIHANARHSFVLVHAPTQGAKLTVKPATGAVVSMTFSPNHKGKVWLVMDLELTTEQAEAVVKIVNAEH